MVENNSNELKEWSEGLFLDARSSVLRQRFCNLVTCVESPE
jgi:hypothetical protein